MQNRFALILLLFFANSLSVLASDWDEDTPGSAKKSNSADNKSHSTSRSKTKSQNQSESTYSNQTNSEFQTKDADRQIYPSATTNDDDLKSGHPLEGKIERSGEASMRLQRPMSDDTTMYGNASGDNLRAGLNDGGMRPLSPQDDNLNGPLKGNASLLGGKSALGDPDEDDAELMVEWDRWHNRFLRAVQLGTQEILNNPDTDDYERPRIDPNTGQMTSRYPLGTGSAFSCQVTAEGQIKNLEIIEQSGFPRYDRAVLRAVQQLAGTQILHFPKGSHRRTVIQPGRIKTATNSDFKYYKFGDVEHVRH